MHRHLILPALALFSLACTAGAPSVTNAWLRSPDGRPFHDVPAALSAANPLEIEADGGRRFVATGRVIARPLAELRAFPAPVAHSLVAQLYEDTNGRRHSRGESAQFAGVSAIDGPAGVLLGQIDGGLAVGDFNGKVWDRFAGQQGNLTACPGETVCVVTLNGAAIEARVYDRKGVRLGLATAPAPAGPAWAIAAAPERLVDGARFAAFVNIRRPDNRGKLGEDGFDIKVTRTNTGVEVALSPVSRRLGL